MGKGFIAGTIVMTQSGSVPIEKIKAGDRVLSRSAHGGERSYRHVIEICAHPPEYIRRLNYSREHEDGTSAIFASDQQHFWSRDTGWAKADSLPVGAELQLGEGQRALLMLNQPVMQTGVQGVGWIQSSEWADTGTEINFAGFQLRIVAQHVARNIALGVCEDSRLQVAVYSLRVEGAGAFYAGRHGVLSVAD